MSFELRVTVLAASLFAMPTALWGANAYLQHNVVADLPGLAGATDSNLVNPWGIASTAGGPFWLTANSRGLALIYDSSGASVSPSINVPIHPTGIVANPAGGFVFCTYDGTISAWTTGANGGSAATVVDRSATGAVYTGLALAGSRVYVANFSAGTIEVYDANFRPYAPSGSFQDAMIPSGFAPFNIQAIGSKLFVTYALEDATTHLDVPGPGNGYVDVFDADGNLEQHFSAGGVLNSPWGVTIAPAGFGDFAGTLLVGNSGDGTINAFNMITGGLEGTVQDAGGKTISIPGLRALTTGNGGAGGNSNTVYFDAGNGHGLFGSLQAAPVVSPGGVVNGASFQPGAAPNTLVSILGSNLAATTRSWQSPDFVNGQLPTQLDGVQVTVDGNPAFVVFISPSQVNILTPTTALFGEIQITNNGLTSSVVYSQFGSVAPAFFQSGGSAAATHADGTAIDSTNPAHAGETIILYGTGFGATAPATPNGSIISAPLPLAALPTITFGGNPAQVAYGGLISPGLFQLNVVTPSVAAGSTPVIARIGSYASPPVQILIE